MNQPERGLRPVCLLTRPSHQVGPLQDSIRAAGLEVISFPTIEICPVSSSPLVQNLGERISDFDIALFVSRNAVDHAFKFLPAQRWPQALQFGVIGQGTHDALAGYGIEAGINPQRSFDSEGLLASPQLNDVAGKKILIVRGQRGRNLLGDTLYQRGAEVTYCEVYNRRLPRYADDFFAQLTQNRFPDIAVFTSAEGLRNCFELIDAASAAALRAVPWILISDRMRETATELGHNSTIIIVAKASDKGILQAVTGWAHNNYPEHQ